MKPSLISEVHQAVLGIPNTEDNGLVGDIKEIKAELKSVNKRVAVVEVRQAEMEVRQEERSRPSKKSLVFYFSTVIAIIITAWRAFVDGG